jgi:hypothetical protein
MQAIDLLLVGDAADGPVEEIVAVRDLAHAERLYGTFYHEAYPLPETATGHTLGVTPWGDAVDILIADSDGALIDRPLFEFAVDGTALTWTKNGDWDRFEDVDPTADPTIYFRARHVPGATSLLKGLHALAELSQPGGPRVHCVRLGGTAATGTRGSFLFRARYAGARYNGTTVEVTSGGDVIVTPAPGTGRVRTYTPASDKELFTLLQADRDRGYQPLFLSGPLSGDRLTLPVGTTTLSGGADGSLTPELLLQFLEDYDLTGVDILCPVGLTVEALKSAGVTEYLAGDSYPVLLVAQSVHTGSSLAAHPNTDRNVCSVGFPATYGAGTRWERTDDDAPLVAGIAASARSGLTHHAFPALLAGSPANPTSAVLRDAVAAGHVLGYRSTARSASLWSMVTGDAEWSVLLCHPRGGRALQVRRRQSESVCQGQARDRRHAGFHPAQPARAAGRRVPRRPPEEAGPSEREPSVQNAVLPDERGRRAAGGRGDPDPQLREPDERLDQRSLRSR